MESVRLWVLGSLLFHRNNLLLMILFAFYRQNCTMEVRTSKIYEELPEIVIKRSSDLIGLAHEADAGSSKQQLRDFLEATVPSADKDEVTDEVSVCLCTSCITYTP